MRKNFIILEFLRLIRVSFLLYGSVQCRKYLLKENKEHAQYFDLKKVKYSLSLERKLEVPLCAKVLKMIQCT